MNPDSYSETLRQLMNSAGIETFRQLSQKARVSEKQLRRLRRGQAEKLPLETLRELARALNLSLPYFLAQFIPDCQQRTSSRERETLEQLRQEYQHLQAQMERQREHLSFEFQQASLQTLEPWLQQWPNAIAAAENNPELPARKIVPLVQPVSELVATWGVEAIASVGDTIPYDPQQHQLVEGTASPGESVVVRRVGYRHGDRLLSRVRVRPADSA